uniref:FAS1 domain-containing protein n=1 Tax=Chromera velia CCMP2878 TaxID=1169474 RepID=A0A0G4FJK0_9ALVE|eukprot:Cvel_17373.t1-p1 / transcript=Cvel_17373.t1 / gene=Cvel_17373 / organism=Chromera_velia_CCMP2878 / gene_product=hypothetical protein / transcript_product=hypothetical protein / location=Cvel_scaffold1381:5213-6504(-) / protein_length=339 / sequence_SO=supercontig / SO=protein_coding / is_pseudo=false
MKTFAALLSLASLAVSSAQSEPGDVSLATRLADEGWNLLGASWCFHTMLQRGMFNSTELEQFGNYNCDTDRSPEGCQRCRIGYPTWYHNETKSCYPGRRSAESLEGLIEWHRDNQTDIGILLVSTPSIQYWTRALELYHGNYSAINAYFEPSENYTIFAQSRSRLNSLSSVFSSSAPSTSDFVKRHIVRGRFSAEDLEKLSQENGTLTTIDGQTLSVSGDAFWGNTIEGLWYREEASNDRATLFLLYGAFPHDDIVAAHAQDPASEEGEGDLQGLSLVSSDEGDDLLFEDEALEIDDVSASPRALQRCRCPRGIRMGRRCRVCTGAGSSRRCRMEAALC